MRTLPYCSKDPEGVLEKLKRVGIWKTKSWQGSLKYQISLGYWISLKLLDWPKYGLLATECCGVHKEILAQAGLAIPLIAEHKGLGQPELYNKFQGSLGFLAKCCLKQASKQSGQSQGK